MAERQWQSPILQSVEQTARDMRPAVAAYYLAHAPVYAQAIEEALPPGDGAGWIRANLHPNLGEEVEQAVRSIYLAPPISYVERGGKLVRPFLATLTLDAFGRDPQRYKPVIALAEVVEVMSQILDDIVDESALRRGGVCAHLAFGTEHALISALSVCDYVVQLIAPLGLDDERAARLYDVLTWEHFVTGMGEAVDLGWGVGIGRPTVERWITQTLARSSSYTYRALVCSAAVVAGASPEDLAALAAYSGKIGLAFQLVDDRFNLLAPAERFGTVRGEDITGGKRTLLLIYALEHLAGTERGRLLHLVGKHTKDPVEIDEAIALMEKSGAFSYTAAMADRLIREAQQAITTLCIPEQYKRIFHDFCHYVTERRR